MHVAQCNTSSYQTLKCFLQSINWKQKVAEIMQKQPVLRINFKDGRDSESRRITLNPLIAFRHLIATYARGVLNDDDDDDDDGSDNGTYTEDKHGNVRCADEDNALRGAKYESIRMAIHRNEKLMAVKYLPYTRQRSLSLIGIEKDDTLIVQNIESDSTTNGEANDKKSLLPTTDECFDPSLKHWMPVIFNLLHERTKSRL